MKRATLVLAALTLLLGGGQAKAGIVSFSQLNLYVEADSPAGTAVKNLQDNAIGGSFATATHDGINISSGAVATATAIQYGSQGSVVFDNSLLGISPGGYGVHNVGIGGGQASGNFKFTFTDSNAGNFYFHYAISSQGTAGYGLVFGGEFSVFKDGNIQVFDQRLDPNTTGDIVYPFAANQSYTFQMSAPGIGYSTAADFLEPVRELWFSAVFQRFSRLLAQALRAFCEE
jgi:hypothetical protein